MGRHTVGQLSRRTGVNIETIRYFEKVGLIASPPRTEGGHRVYDDDHLRALSFIRRARELGFTPNEVRGILTLGGQRMPVVTRFGRSPRDTSTPCAARWRTLLGSKSFSPPPSIAAPAITSRAAP